MYGAVNHCFCCIFTKSVMNTPTKSSIYKGLDLINARFSILAMKKGDIKKTAKLNRRYGIFSETGSYILSVSICSFFSIC